MGERVAVLVDGDNISAKFAPEISKIASSFGKTDTIRVYTDARRLTGWHEAHGFRVIHAGDGKNASDLLLAIDAMQLALSDDFSTFVVASSDGDFMHLAQRLREMGRTVVGIGEEKAPLSFRLACHNFKEVCSGPITPNSTSTATEMDRDIHDMISDYSEKGEGMAIAELAPKMHAKFGIRISSFPEKNWRNYFTQRDTLYEIDPRSVNAKVRFIQSGFK